MKTIFGSALVMLPPSTTEYIRFNGETLSEWNGASDWSDYIYAGGKRIARADNYEDQLVTQGSSCSSCATYFRLKNGAGYLLSGYVIQSGDKLLVRQWQSSGVHGGVGLDFASGGNTLGVGNMASDTWINQWHYRSFDLSTMAGNTVTSAWLTTQSTPASGGWNINYQDFVLLSYDGTVHKLYSHDKSANLEISGTTGPTYSVTHVPNLGNFTSQTTTFYHGDHLGSSRLLSSADGYPTWQGTYYPYGKEYTPPGSTDNTATVNNYKFTGKERDTESGLDYFGARYFSSSMGRWMSPDWSGSPAPVPYADPDNPQTLNLYAYVANNPMSRADSDGHCPLGEDDSCGPNYTVKDVRNIVANEVGAEREIPGSDATLPELYTDVANAIINGEKLPMQPKNAGTQSPKVNDKTLSNIQTCVEAACKQSQDGKDTVEGADKFNNQYGHSRGTRTFKTKNGKSTAPVIKLDGPFLFLKNTKTWEAFSRQKDERFKAQHSHRRKKHSKS